MDLYFNDIVKQGYVYFRSKHLWIYRRFWLVLRRDSSKGPKRLERFSSEQAANCQCHHKVTDLTKIRNVTRPPRDKKKHAVVLTFNDDSPKAFACDSELDAKEWCNVLQMECLETKMTDLPLEEPVLFNTSLHRDHREQFHVFMKPSQCIDFSGECNLQITCDTLLLWDIQNPGLKITSWPLRSLRRYGRGQNWFTFEAGRMCDTGEGLFTFQTPEGERLYHRVNEAVLATVEQEDWLCCDKRKTGTERRTRESTIPWSLC
ncbi:docking protein 5-like isoform X1 [Oncorhynchus kisutch]|uniref:Docking protein 5-like n=1 Tax=Oncorhynchus kisutch TaxID=8019 RepID=A0A8C7EZ55_ONCKI|nr:docking protein 5-like isoform X1 [Oncorhynchus kisutch]